MGTTKRPAQRGRSAEARHARLRWFDLANDLMTFVKETALPGAPSQGLGRHALKYSGVQGTAPQGADPSF